MHHAKIENSPSLQRILKLLKTGRAFTTREIDRMADVCAVSTRIQEIRENGYDIVCTRKGKLYYYQLVPEGQMELML